VADRVRAGEAAEGPALPHDASLRDALSQFVARGATRLPVVDAATGRALGAIHFGDLLAPPPAR
jgi:osmoprotectant transport system ATP-binding protein